MGWHARLDRRFTADAQLGHRATARVDGDAHLAHFRTGDLPRKAQPVGETVGHPVRGELGRQEQVQRAGFLAERSELDRLDPLRMQLRAEILLQPLADVGPVCCKIQRFLVLDHRAVFSLPARCSPLVADPVGSGHGRHVVAAGPPCEIINLHASLPRLPYPHAVRHAGTINLPPRHARARQTPFEEFSCDADEQ